ncbi:MAG: gluconate kinase [Deltaproteobacteria bacterium 13_1_40CM_4_54_4]|nr:MAG: gluconate kinase [Deltaproteobacteria bacterium 13_1_40CM_4_54_4]TMB73333.1 MAG: gluconokinase [Deltaproteobacteria bacterium]
MIIVLMGVTGSGKSTVGKLLAQQLGWKFFEGDDFHSPANIEKMRRGMPLSDDDRRPWLEAIRESIRQMVERSENAVIACSALKHSYRQMLRITGEVVFVYLKANIDIVRERLKNRTGHFMNPNLIQSQFDTLEESEQALRVDASLPPGEIVRRIRTQLRI